MLGYRSISMENTKMEVGRAGPSARRMKAPTFPIVQQTSPRDATHITILKIFTRSMLFEKYLPERIFTKPLIR